MRFVTLKTLKMIKDRGYKSHDGYFEYDPEVVNNEIERKTKRPENRYIRKDKTNFNDIYNTGGMRERKSETKFDM